LQVFRHDHRSARQAHGSLLSEPQHKGSEWPPLFCRVELVLYAFSHGGAREAEWVAGASA